MAEFWESSLILRVVAGSRAQGLANETSDTDTRGVCIPPARYLLGLSTFEQHESDGGDHVVYALDKFVRLALQGNPNILETLFVEPEDVLHATAAGRELLGVRASFLTRAVGRRFVSYALHQLKRMERHHRWLVSPPESSADADWRGYRDWKAARNPKRAALEERYGYDTKHAMHLVRLLRMGDEVLTRGELTVRRPDAEWLRGIRGGALAYEEVLVLAREMSADLEQKAATSPLPEEPDHATAEELVIRLHRETL